MNATKWTKNGQDLVSACGRFEIRRYMRRNGIEWQLIDRVVPVESGVSGCTKKLQDAKDAAQWRIVNRLPQVTA